LISVQLYQRTTQGGAKLTGLFIYFILLFQFYISTTKPKYDIDNVYVYHHTSRLLVKVEHLNTPQLSSVYVLEDLCYSRYLMQIFVNSIKRLNSPVPDRVKPSFVFLTSGHSDAQP